MNPGAALSVEWRGLAAAGHVLSPSVSSALLESCHCHLMVRDFREIGQDLSGTVHAFNRLGRGTTVAEDRAFLRGATEKKMQRNRRKLRLLAAFAAFGAGEAYSIYVIFFTPALTPPSVYVVERYTHHRLLSGKIGDIEEVFNWDGFIPVVLSFIVFRLAWCLVWVTAEGGPQLRRQAVVPSQEIHAYPPVRGNAGNRTGIVSTGSEPAVGTCDQIEGRLKEAVNASTEDQHLRDESRLEHRVDAWLCE